MSIKPLTASSSDRTGFNRRWYASSDDLQVYAPATQEEVVELFQDILDSNLYANDPKSVQISCGRHCYEDFVYNSDTKAVIDMTGLKSFSYDSQTDTFAVDVGYSNWDTYRILNNLYKKALPAGSCYSVGLGGHITGGGYGLLSRLYGLTIDHLTSVDMVITTDGKQAQLVTASETVYSPLYWAVRGGGEGQFGIITRYYFSKLPLASETMSTRSLSWDWKDEKDGSLITKVYLVRYQRFFTRTIVVRNEDSWNTWANMMLNHVDAGHITISAFSFYVPSLHGSFDKYKTNLEKKSKEIRLKAAEIAPLSTKHYPLCGHPYIPSTTLLNPPAGSTEINRHYTYLAGTQQVNGSGANQFGYYKSAYLTSYWTDVQITEAYNYLTKIVNNPDNGRALTLNQSLIQVDSYGGKINTVKSEDAAIPQRSSVMKLQFQSYWDSDVEVGNGSDPVLEKFHTDWLSQMYTAMFSETGGYPDPTYKADSNVDGCYFNYPDKALGYANGDKPLDFALQLYFGRENLQKLRAIKEEFNPQGWFGNSQTI